MSVKVYRWRRVRNFSSFVNLGVEHRPRKLSVLVHSCQENRAGAVEGADGAAGTSFFIALGSLLRCPQRVLFLWNWKSAGLSIILRVPIFLAAAIQRGFVTSVSTVLTECLFCVTTAGFYGAIVQNLRDAEPEWLALLFLTVVLPGIFQIFEFLLHRLRGTPHLRAAEAVSLVASGISALFNWYAMRRGALLVGGEGDRFAVDLRRLPRLLISFMVAPVAWLRHRGSKRPD